jgi:hypothetical protein
MIFTHDGANKSWIWHDVSDGIFKISNETAGSRTDISIDINGNVGIGIENAYHELDVDGTGRFDGGTGIGVIGKTSNSSIAVSGDNTSGCLGHLGLEDWGVYGELESSTLGAYAVYGDGVDNITDEGTDYEPNLSLGGVIGFNLWGNQYTFGVAGFSYLDEYRSGGTLGGDEDGSPWGCLGYRNSSGSYYGGYFTNYTTGTGKSNLPDMPLIDCGIAAWGDLFGADIHGVIYGIYSEGENYAVYADGDVYKNKLDVHLQKNQDQSQTPLFTNVSTEVTVMTSGIGQLSAGKCSIQFDENFSHTVSREFPVIVTVTPIGKSEGVYLTDVSKDGFSVEEYGESRSHVQFSFIAIGRRAGYEEPQLAKEVISPDYEEKLERGFHNDGDIETNGEGLYYENGELVVGIHPSTLSDPTASENREYTNVPSRKDRTRVDPRPEQAPETTRKSLVREEHGYKRPERNHVPFSMDKKAHVIAVKEDQ